MNQSQNEIVEAKLRQDAVAIASKASEVANIETPEQEARAVEFCSQAKIRIGMLETARTRLVKPLNDHVKMINAEFKSVISPMEEAIQIVKDGMTEYRRSETMKAAEEQKAMLEQEARLAARQGDVDSVQEIAKAHAEVEAAAPSIVRTQTGKASFRTAYRFEIVDAAQIPHEFLMPDEAKIKDAVKAAQGEITIAGVRVWKEEVPVIGS